MAKSVILKPLMSEKAYALSESTNTFVFGIDKTANRFDVARAVTEQYQITPAKVRISHKPGKKQSIISRRRRLNTLGQRSDVYKAYVTLKTGDKLPIFAAVEDDTEPTKPKKERK